MIKYPASVSAHSVNGSPGMRHGLNRLNHGQHTCPVVHICFNKGNLADVIYNYIESKIITFLFFNNLPDVPKGYNFDFVNADALLNLLSVKNNQIVTPSGMRYKVLALDSNSMQMTLNVVKKIRDLVKEGAVVVGPKPTGTPSLSDDKVAFNAIVNELWGVGNSVQTI